MERFPPDEAVKAALALTPTCMYCGSDDGHSELLDTGDADSLGGFEVWFCCHACRDAGEPCETFHRLTPPNEELTGAR